jgi:hypothetical protein
MVHNTHKVISELLGPGFECKTFQSSFTGHGSDPKLQALLQNPMKPTEEYPLDVALLFPDGDCTNIGHIFKVEALFRVSAGILFAHMSADCISVS